MSAEDHLATAAAFIAVAEAGDAKRVAYERAADEIIAAQREDPTLTQRAIAHRLGKVQSEISRLLKWRDLPEDRRAEVLPHGGHRDANVRSTAKLAARERPDDFADAFEQAPPAAQRKIAERILAEPASPAAKIVRDAAEDAELKAAKARSKQAKDAAEQRLRPTTLRQFFHRILGQMHEWTRSLRQINGDFDDLADDQREQVYRRHLELRDALQANIDALERKPDLTVIEGRAHEPRRRLPA